MTTINSSHFQSLRKKRNSISSKIIDLDNVNITVLLNFFILCFTAILFFLFLACFLRLLHTIFFCLMCVCVVSACVFDPAIKFLSILKRPRKKC